MKIDLYPCFKHLKEFNTIWLYSDPHFGDKQISSLRNNNISDEEQLRRINSKVGRKDVIIILGDIGDVNYVKKINGYKILIRGNHDKGKTNYQRVVNETITFNSGDLSYDDSLFVRKISQQLFDDPIYIQPYVAACDVIFAKYRKKKIEDNHLFNEVYDGIVMLNDKILLSHEPIYLPFVFNIHGHDHSNKVSYDDGLHLNVCAEHIDYTPISLNELIKNGYFKDVPSIHRITIDKASNKTT